MHTLSVQYVIYVNDTVIVFMIIFSVQNSSYDSKARKICCEQGTLGTKFYFIIKSLFQIIKSMYKINKVQQNTLSICNSTYITQLNIVQQIHMRYAGVYLGCSFLLFRLNTLTLHSKINYTMFTFYYTAYFRTKLL